MPGGFTLVELLVVIVVLAILAALLLPAINSAVRRARNAAVSAEINQLAQALEQFKSKYGDYPPSRVLLVENGNYSQYLGNTSLSASDANSPGTGDITIGQLAVRSMTAIRKFWPRVQLSTSTTPPNISTTYWYDFNGNGTLDGAYILHGHECLVFFLGGVPLYDSSSQGFGMTGFGKDPNNPFSNSISVDSRYNNGPNPMYNANRQPPIFEFNPGRLYQDPSNATQPNNPANWGWGIPGYYDTLGSEPPQNATGTEGTNFFAYFSANGSGNYDPNDVNFQEADNQGVVPISLQYYVGYNIYGSTTTSPYTAVSPSPNPYTSTLTAGTSSGTVTYQKPQTFQIISSGADGFYGVGGQYQALTTSATVPLPYDANNTSTTDGSIRQREYDNLSNFKSGTLN